MSYEATLHAIRDADDEAFLVIDALAPDFPRCIKESRYPKTLHALFAFSARSAYLKTAIFDLAQARNLYAINVLYRSLAEHHLRGFYLFVRALDERTDQPGEDYFQYCGAGEMLAYARAWESFADLTKEPRNESFNALEIVGRVYPSVKTARADEIGAKSNQFRFHNILRFLAEHPSKFVGAERPFLAKLVPIYSELSGYTHGGPAAGWENAKQDDEGHERRIIEIAEWAFFFSSTSWFLALMVFTREFPIFSDAAGRMRMLLQRKLGEGQQGSTMGC